MQEFLEKQNKQFWNNFREMLQQFNVEAEENLRADEQAQVSLFANETVGDIASSLAEFYQNVLNAPEEAELEQVAATKLGRFSNNVLRAVPIKVATERDNLELTLIENGYRGNTFNLATKALYNSLYTRSTKLERALDETIEKASHRAPTLDREIMKA